EACRKLSRAEPAPLRPNHRTVDEKESKYCQAGIVARALQVTVEKAECQVGSLAVLQIHHDERDFAHDVAPAHVVVEFDAIEYGDAVVDQRDVVEMKVAVAFPHEPLPAACLELVTPRVIFAVRPLPQCIESRATGFIVNVVVKLGEVVEGESMDFVRTSEGSISAGHLDRAMKRGDAVRQGVDM